MQKHPLYSKAFFAIFLFLTAFVFSCKKNSSVPDSTNSKSMDGLKSWYMKNSKDMADNDNWLRNLSPSWTEIYLKTVDGKSYYEIALDNPENILISNGLQRITERERYRNQLRLLIIDDEGGQRKAYIMSLLNTGNVEFPLSTIHHLDPRSATVSISYYNLDGSLSHGLIYNKGKYSGQFRATNRSGIYGSRAQPNPGCYYVPQIVYGYACVGSGDDGQVFCRWSYLRTTEVQHCPEGEGGDDGDPLPDPSYNGSVPLPSVQNNISNTCLKNILDTMLNKSLNNRISDILVNVFNKSDAINISYSDVTTLPDSVNGALDQYSVYNNGTSYSFRVLLNKNKLPTYSKEYAAATIMHETIHAFLVLKGDAASMQHDQMALGYRTAIASALKELYGVSNDVADALSWQGLTKSSVNYWNVFQAQNPVTASQIANILNNYSSGTSGRYCGP